MKWENELSYYVFFGININVKITIVPLKFGALDIILI